MPQNPAGPAGFVPDILVITHAMLSGAAILIPIPFLDDFAVSIVRQNLVRAMAKYHEVEISPEEARLLAGQDSAGGCWQGPLALLKYPFKILQHVIRALEVKKTIETAVSTYYSGILLNEVLRNGWYRRDKFRLIQHTIQRIKQDANQDVVMEVFRSYLTVNKEHFKILTAWGRETLTYLLEVSRAQTRGLFRRMRLVRATVEERPETLFERQPPQITELARQIYENLNVNLLGKPQAQRKEMFEQLAIALRPAETPQNEPLQSPK